MMLFVPWTSRPARAAAPVAADTASLLRALAAGDAAALELLYRQQADAVYRYALALAGDAAAAADATQEAFIALAARPAGFDPSRGELGAYLAGIARHHLLALRRRAGSAMADKADKSDGGDEAALAALPADGPSPEALLVQRQDVARVRAALSALPWAFREAVVLVDLQGRAYAEAAAIAGCELNTLRTRVHRGRARLAELLRPGAGDL